ncbi:MAG: 50S ribosomal protein L11 methyltransferase [Acidimicrobiia bacterium]
MSDEALSEHRTYLADTTRLECYDRAIRREVRPGDVVLDLGAGTGILGLMAARAGAARVYAVEAGPIIAGARDIARANGYGDSIRHVRGYSTELTLPEPVDVVVGDQIGGFGYDAGVFAAYADAARRLAKPEARFVPGTLSLLVAIAELPAQHAAAEWWSSRPAGFDMSTLRTHESNMPRGVHVSAGHLLSAVIPVVERPSSDDSPIHVETTVIATRSGTVHGLVGMFSAKLADGAAMSNIPGDASCIDRWQLYFPFDNPVAIAAGDPVAVKMRINPVSYLATWEIAVAGTTQRQSTFAGRFVWADDVQELRRSTIPSVSERGSARRTIASLADGRHTTGSIVEITAQAHPSLDAATVDRLVYDVLTELGG